MDLHEEQALVEKNKNKLTGEILTSVNAFLNLFLQKQTIKLCFRTGRFCLTFWTKISKCTEKKK